MKLSSAGTTFDAEFLVEGVPGRLSFTMLSQSGSSKGVTGRNSQYGDALRVILERLAARDGRITDALVTSAAAIRAWPSEEDRRLERDVPTYPILLSEHDPALLRTVLTEAMRAAARDQSLRPGGNGRRRVTFDVDVPGVADRDTLAAYLRTGVDTSLSPVDAAERLAPKSRHQDPLPSMPARQGYMSDARRRKAVEDRAMYLARLSYEERGFAVRDVSGNNPYDLHCTRADGSEVRVECKGTTGGGGTIQLTVGEVKHARAHSGGVALVVVHDIRIVDGPDGPVGRQGRAVLTEPWDVDSGILQATRFDWSPNTP